MDLLTGVVTRISNQCGNCSFGGYLSDGVDQFVWNLLYCLLIVIRDKNSLLPLAMGTKD